MNMFKHPNHLVTRGNGSGLATRNGLAPALAVLLGLTVTGAAFGAPGVTSDAIRVGGVMDLKGDSRGLGLGMKAGIEAAFRDKTVQGRKLEFIALNDNYSPPKTIEATNKLIEQDIFVMLGNVGTPTAKVSLPILAENKVPAVGFFTGAGILRPGVGDIINFRASYVQETASVIRAALESGIDPTGICAYVQNDAYGMAGITGIKLALASQPGMDEIVSILDQMIQMSGANPPRNNMGPVGVYQRNTLYARGGFDSLKSWEQLTGTRCQLVVSVGAYANIARFSAYSRNKGANWIVSAVSFTGADNFRSELKNFGVNDGIVMTQVVPPLDSDLPIVEEARQALRGDFGYVSLEGYIVGRLFIAALEQIPGPITRQGFLNAVRDNTFEISGLTLDFTEDNQGSDLVALTYLDQDGYRNMVRDDWKRVLPN